jgi:carbamoyltransferase
LIILGIWDGTPSSAALFVDGKIISMMIEERLTRKKNQYGFPINSINAILTENGIDINDIDHFAMSTPSLSPTYFYTLRNTTFSVQDYWKEQNEYWYPKFFKNENPEYLKIFEHHLDKNFPYDKSLIKDETDSKGMWHSRVNHLCKTFKINKEKVSCHDHHSCHAYYGYLSSDIRLNENVLVYTTDGNGDKANGTIWIGEKGKELKNILRTNMCNIGRMYRYATLLLGMRPADHEYKVMGLAAYNSDVHGRAAYDIYAQTLQNDGLDFKYNVPVVDHFFHFKHRLEGQRFDAIAYGIQKRTEELLTQWVANGIDKTGIKNIILSGGVAQNIKANKLISELPELDNLYVPPGPGDESLAAGAAFMAALKLGFPIEKIQPLENAYLGSRYNDSDLEDALEKFCSRSWKVTKTNNANAAKILAKGGVIARFGTDPMEFGPRALGNRSILADPRNNQVIHHINKMVKMRDFWMPFAPSIISEREKDYLVNPKQINGKYMSIGFASTEMGRRDLQAGLHPFDQTARPQIVRSQDNYGYHNLIKEFEKITGVGALLNTSFNIHGEPIVCTPYDALNTFEKCGLKFLLLGDFLVEKDC